ncbi:MAG: TonB-dependent receptor, partial [bacterium]
VDIEGNVSLRGSENFTVLVDGRPSPLDPSDALQLIPAGTIDRVEIVTNPSARYDPDGVSGIVNVILKQQRGSGLSGVVNTNAGLGNKYGANAQVVWTSGILTLQAGADYSRRASPGTRETERSTTRNDTTAWVASSGSSLWDGRFWGARGGLDLQWTPQDRTSLSGRWGGRDMTSTQLADFRTWFEGGADTVRYTNDESSSRRPGFISFSLDHRHIFGEPVSGRSTRPEHELTARVGWWRRHRDGETVTLLFEADTAVSGQRSFTTGPADRWNLNLDYALPLREADKLEAGYQGRFERAEENNLVEEYLPATGSWRYQERFSRDAGAVNDIHSLYSTYAGEWQAFGYKAGLRGERAERVITAGDDTFAIPVRWDLFPTAHLSYQLPANAQLMASYARRIGRTRHFFLDPFQVWQDAYTVVQGNPELLPEYIDSWELGTLLPLGASRVSAELFHRVTHNKVERIISLYPETTGVMLHTFENVGSDRSLGLELMLDLTPVKWYTVTLGADLYDYRVAGEYAGRDFSYSSFNYSGRLANEFRLPTNTRIQLNGRYRSPSVTSQGRREGSLMTDLGVRQQFLNRQLSVTFQVRDLFGTGRHEYESGGEGYDFYSRSLSTREAPVVMLNLSWNFNNFRPDRRRTGDNDIDLGPGEDEM